MLSFSKTDFLSSPGSISHSLYSRAFLEPEAYFNIQSVFQLSCTEPLIPDLGHKGLHCSHAPVTQPLPEETGVVTGTNVLVLVDISEDGVSGRGDCHLPSPSVSYTGQLISFE